VYDGLFHGVNVTGLLDGDKVTYSTDGVTYDLGEIKYKDVSDSGKTVYVKVERDGTPGFTGSAKVIITKASLIAKAKNLSKIYYDPVPALEVEYTGFVTGESENDLTIKAVLETTCTQSSGVGAYPITFSTEPESGNYDIETQTGTLTVNPATLTVTADNKTTVYGGTPTYTATIAGFLGTDNSSVVSGEPELTSSYIPGTSGVGTYEIDAAQGTLTTANYTFSFEKGTLTVNPKELKVTADNKTIIYGGLSPMFTATYDGFITGQDESVLGGTLAFSSPYTVGSNAGTYPITPSGLTSTNYDIKYVDGTLTVNKAALTVTAEDKAVTFLNAPPAYTAKYTGFVAGDTAAKLGGTLVFSCSYAAGSAAGTYPITPSGLTSDNYNITFVDGTLTVNTLMLTVTFQDYNGTTLGTSTVAYGTAATPPANPTREGYTFTGWSTSFDKVTSALTVTAQYAINTYTVRFLAADGVTEIGTPQTVNFDGAATFPTAPRRMGYAFDEWVLTGDNPAYPDSLTHVKENINAVASYIRNGYTVTFVDYDGSVIGTDGVLYGQNAEAPVPPTREGYTFIGWDREFNPVTGNITVTAQYEINQYTVRFLDYDGTVIDTQTVDYNTAATAPADPTRDGYTFTGWDTSFDAVTSDLTVTAQYEPLAPVQSEPVPEADNTIPDEPVPSTGGDAFAWWWITVIALGAGLLFFLIFFVWKRKRKEEGQQ